MPNISPSVLDVWDAMIEAFILPTIYSEHSVISMVGCYVTLVNKVHIITQMSLCLLSFFAIIKVCV
jgi:hypothetical protein